MKPFLAFFLLLATAATAQDKPGPAGNTLAAFSIWKPKEGQTAHFEAGYKKHLQWHSSAKDSWNWYGWFIISGERAGQFVDATFGHAWADLDRRVDPAGDAADNNLHTEPFADYLTGYKLSRLPFSDPEDSTILGARFLRMLTIDVSDPSAVAAMVENLATGLKQKVPLHKFLAYKKVDGGRLGQIVIFIGAANFEELGRTAGWQDELLHLDTKQPRSAILSITAETLVFRRDMSLNL